MKSEVGTGVKPRKRWTNKFVADLLEDADRY